MTTRQPVDAVTEQAWVEVAQSARVLHRMLLLLPEPVDGSNFNQVEQFYPFERVSVRARAYLEAALEHLLLWADYAAPLAFHPDQETNFTLRPAHTLSRAALEAAAQAVWLMDTSDARECVRRHVSLMRWDLQELRKSKLDKNDKAFVSHKEEELVQRVAAVFTDDQIEPPNGYLAVIRSACSARQLNLEPDDAERLWRAASGAAHGKYWPVIELRHAEIERHDESGHMQASYPDAGSMTAVLKAAETVATYGVLRFADHCGADIAATLSNSVEWLATQIPLQHGASRQELLQALRRRHLSFDASASPSPTQNHLDALQSDPET